MSTLKVTNIQATGETASRAVSGVAAAWCNYDGDNTAIQDSNNIASIADSGNGRHQFAFTNAMSNSDYAATGNAGHSGFHNVATKSSAFGTVSASQVTIRVSQTDSSADDDDAQTSFAIHGDLA
jgi:hypothetical protein